jgi:hypothetical protein
LSSGGTTGNPVDEERIEMNQRASGPEPGDTAATDESGLAERLIRDEFSDLAPAHRARSHREAKHAAESETSSVAQADGNGVDGTFVAFSDDTAKVPVVEVGPPAADDTIVMGAPIIHEEFAQPKRAPKLRSHRAGMLAGLGVVGALLVVLVVFAPGGSKPRLPAQSVHDVSPISASGPRTAAATTPTTAAPTTTSSAPAASTTTTPAPKPGGTITTYISYTEVPGSTTPAQTVTPATTASAPPQTTAPPPTTTTTTAPPPPTTTTPTTHCLLIFCS